FIVPSPTQTYTLSLHDALPISLQDGFYLSDFGVRNVEIVGPQVGSQLQTQAKLAVLYSLAGMLVYLGIRFEWIYGVAAVVTVFQDRKSTRLNSSHLVISYAVFC